MKNVSNAFNFIGEQGLKINAEGKLIDSIFGLEITGVGVLEESDAKMVATSEDWEDEDFTRLS